MSGIYIRDLDVRLVEDRFEGTRRPIDVLLPILRLIIPQGTVVIKQWSTPLGTRIDFGSEGDANFILNTRVIATLTSHNLKAQFSNVTSFNRLVWLVDTPQTVYSKDILTLINNISQSTNIRVPELRKYENTSGRKYLILTTNSKSDRDSLLAIGHIQIDDSRIKCEKTIQKSRQSSLQPTQRPTLPVPPQNPGGHGIGHGPAYQHHHARPTQQQQQQHQQSHQSPTIIRNRWLNYDEHFPGLRAGTPHVWETTTGNPLSQNHNGQSVQAFKNEHDLKFYIEASTSICHKLSTGIEKPTEYVSVLNEIFSNKGLPTIDIPNHYLESSRIKFVQVNSRYDPLIPPPSLHPLPTSTPSMSATSLTPSSPATSLAPSMPVTSLAPSMPASPLAASSIASSMPASSHAPSKPVTSLAPSHASSTSATSLAASMHDSSLTPCMPASSPSSSMPDPSLASSMPVSSLNPSLTPSKSNTQTSTIYTSPISAPPVAPSPPITRGKIAKNSVSLQNDNQNG